MVLLKNRILEDILLVGFCVKVNLTIPSITPSFSENMAKVSVLIPSRNEKYLTKTVDGIFAKATGNIEVIIVLEGPTSYRLPHKRNNLILIQKPQAEGLRKPKMMLPK